jgi:cytochrome c-type biogenesis protein CcmH
MSQTSRANASQMAAATTAGSGRNTTAPSGGVKALSVSLLRSRGFLASFAVLAIVAAIWIAAMAASARPLTLDDRVNVVGRQLQCPACQTGESVADSPSSIAASMRAVIREKLQRGESEQQVVQDFVNSYGEGIRLSPPMSGFTLLMWLAPVVMLLAGIGVVVSVARRWRAMAPAAEAPDPELDGLSETELERYRALLEAELDGDLPANSIRGPGEVR